MPLCQIVGVTSLHTTFPIAWCLVSSENSCIYKWLLDQLVACAEDHDGVRAEKAAELRIAGVLSNKIWVHEPYVIITDFDHKLKNAINQTYGPSVACQICIFHIMKNLLFNLKQKWIGTLQGSSIGNQGSRFGGADPKPLEET